MHTFRVTDNRPRLSRDNHESHHCGGFALVVAIMLMSFIFVLLVSVGTFTRVEVQSTVSQRTQAVARANARMGLMVALGQLQSAAGPDQRVTATSDVAGLSTGREHWAGVWDSDSGDLLQWLVSGQSETGEDNAGGEIVFLSTLATQDQVRVPRVDLPEVGGGYAWWISDEGVKAKLNVLDPFHRMEDPEVAAAMSAAIAPTDYGARERQRLLVAQENGIALLLGADHVNLSLDSSIKSHRDLLTRLGSLRQLPLLQANDDDDGLFSARNLVHDVTLHSKGVLSDVHAGGLKHDLTAAFENNATAPSNFPASWWNRLKDYYHSTGAPALDAHVDTTGDSQSYFPVLVKTNFAIPLFLGDQEVVDELPHWARGRKVYVGLGVAFSLHNPYDVELNLPDGFIAEVILPAEADPANDTNNMVKHFRVASARTRNGTLRTADEIEAAFDASGFARFHVRLELNGSVSFEPGQTRIFAIDAGGTAKDITGVANGALVADLKPTMTNADYLYRQVIINEGGSSDTYGGLYDSLSSQDDQIARFMLDMDRSSDLRVQMRVGLPDSGGGEPLWFSGFRAPLELGSFSSDQCRIDSESDFYFQINAPGNNPSGGFGLSFEMPMSRRQSAVGAETVRQLVDFNMRAVPASWNASPNSHIEPDSLYRRVVTKNKPTYGGPMTPLKWTHHDIYPSSANTRKRQRAMWAHNVYWIPTNEYDTKEEFGWAGPSPFGADSEGNGGSFNNIRDVDAGTVYFDVPTEKPYSLGALRHANVFDSRYTPAYSVGSSWAPAFPANVNLGDEDDVFRLNDLLWDRYFFSSFTAEFQAALDDGTNWNDLPALPNSRLVYCFDRRLTAEQREELLSESDTAASQLMVNGAFNVNSTSVAAWRAVLSSLRDTLGQYRDDNTITGTPFPRFSRTLFNNGAQPYATGDGTFTTSSNDILGGSSRESIYQGIRMLSDAEIERLADNIVREIKRNAEAFETPFLSLGAFVNRSLTEVDSEPATRLKGVLQLAIDDGPWSGEDEDDVLLRWSGPEDEGPAINLDVLKNDILENNSINMDSMGLVHSAPANSYPNGYLALEPRSADAPAYLTQSDILSVLGPILTVRSDTFIIRAYGDAVDPLGSRDRPTARAWCEAVVQRLPEPMQRSNTDNPLTAAYYEPSAATKDTLGRRFVIVSFRWLQEGEI